MSFKVRRAELAFLLATISAALFFLREAFDLPMVMRGALGPGLYPALVLAGIALAALVLLIRTLTRKEIRILSPFLVGLQHDTALRRLGDAAGGLLDTPVRVVARTGSGRFSAFDIARRAPRDGTTLALVTSDTSDLPNLEAAPFALANFSSIDRLWFDPDVVAVRSDAPWTGLAEFLGAEHPNTLRLGVAQGARATAPVRAWLVRHGVAAIETLEFDAPAPLMKAIAERRVDAALLSLSEAETAMVDGRLRCLAVLSDEPATIASGSLPTSRESGFPLASGRWAGLMLPGPANDAGDDRPDRLHAAFATAAARLAAHRGDHSAEEGQPRWAVLPPAAFARFLEGLREHARSNDPQTSPAKLQRGRIEGLVLAALGLFLFPPLMGLVGFTLATTLFLSVLMLLLWTDIDIRGVVTIAAVSLGVAFLLDYLFAKVFYVVFPSGSLWSAW